MAAISGTLYDIILELQDDLTLPTQTRVAVSELATVFRSQFQSKILSILLPLIYKLGKRFSAVAMAVNEESRAEAIKYFTSDVFIKSATRAAREECVDAINESKVAIQQGKKTRDKGLPLITLSAEDLEVEIMPRISAMINAISAKAQRYSPTTNRTFERMCRRLDDIARRLSFG